MDHQAYIRSGHEDTRQQCYNIDFGGSEKALEALAIGEAGSGVLQRIAGEFSEKVEAGAEIAVGDGGDAQLGGCSSGCERYWPSTKMS